MNWSILLGVALIVYAAWILVRHIRRSAKGDCAACPYCSGCGGDCKKHEGGK